MKTTNQSLTDNLTALTELFNSIHDNRPADLQLLSLYSGFGNIKEVALDPNEDAHWVKYPKLIRSKIAELHQLLEQFFPEPSEKAAVLSSIRTSTLTAYFTPAEITRSIAAPFLDPSKSTYSPAKILEPAAGTGAFIEPLKGLLPGSSITAVEKDLLTSLFLEKINAHTSIKTSRSAFEEFSNTKTNAAARYDLIISNIPFGSFKVFDSEYSKLPKSDPRQVAQQKIHSYFFTKSIDRLKPSGHLGFITSTGIADSTSNKYLRDHLIRNCSLIAAVRLPNTIFSEAGTAVTTDYILLQKRETPLKSLEFATADEKAFLRLSSVEHSQGDISIQQEVNSYFVDNSGNFNNRVIGRPDIGYFNDKQQIVITSGESLQSISEQLLSLLNNSIPAIEETMEQKKIAVLPQSGQLSLFDELVTISTSPKAEKKQPTRILLDEKLLLQNNLIEGNVFTYKDIVGKISFSQDGPELVSLTQQYDVEKFKISSLLLVTYKQLLQEDFDNPDSDRSNHLRQELNSIYDRFTSLYGLLSDRNNSDVKTLDVEGFKLQGLENFNESTKTFEKSDIFSASIYTSLVTENENLEDLIKKSLNSFGKIDLEFISKKSGKPLKDILSEGIDKRLFYFNPKVNEAHSIHYPELPYAPTDDQFANYTITTKDEFLSGPVRYKIAELQQHGHRFLPQNIDFLSESIDDLKKVDNPFIGIAELDVQLGENWIPIEYFSRFATQLLDLPATVTKSNSNSEYKVNITGNSHTNQKEIAVKCRNGRTLTGDKLLTEALHGTLPKITYSVGDKDNKVTYLDKEAMSAAQMKIETIHQKWRDFVLADSDISEKLELIYNNTQNLDVERVFNGDHLEFSDMANYIPLKHQRDGIWQMLVQNGGLVDHIVGAGKTLLMSGLSMELRRLGLARKVMIIAMKANAEQIYTDFKLAYPNAKVIAPSDSDFTPAARVQFFQKIVNNNWDAIILTHDQFQKIPQSREIQYQVLHEEIRNLEQDLAALNSDKDQAPSRRQIKGLITRIENKKVQMELISNSINKDPHLITFDKMGIDHLIVDESQQFKNLEYTTRFDRVAGLGDPEGSQRALNLLFAVRTLQKYHRDDKGVTFCSGTTISNSLIELYLLMKYLRPKELEYRQMPNFDSWARTHAKLARDYELSVTNEVKPKERFRSFLKVPELARWYRSFTNVANEQNIVLDKPALDPIFVEVQPTDTQKIFMQEIINSIQLEDFSYFGMQLSEKQMNAKMLIATSLATKVSLDVRLIDPTLSINDGSKIPELAEKVASIYRNSEHYKGTQFIFCDVSTPTSATAKEFNIYQSIKEELTERHGIPSEQIQFIHDYDSKKARIQLFNQVNAGEVRVILGSTQKMGVGVNIQNRCAAMHHFDIPWTPKDLEQRNGRGARQGNLAAKNYQGNKIPSYTYGTVGTLDAYKYFLVDIKHRFIQQIKSNNIDFRTLDEGDMDADGAMSPAAFIARLSGKEELLEKNKVDKRLADFQMKKSVLKKELQRCISDIQKNTQLIPKIETNATLYKEDLRLAEGLFSSSDKLKVIYSLTIPSGKTLSDLTEIRDYLQINCARFIDSKPELDSRRELGTIGQFQFFITHTFQSFKPAFVLEIHSPQTGLYYYYGNNEFHPDAPARQFRFPYDALHDIGSKIDKQEEWLEKVKTDLHNDKNLLDKLNPNQFDEEIEKLSIRSQELANIIEGTQKNSDDPELEKDPLTEKIIELVKSLEGNSDISSDLDSLNSLFQKGQSINKEQTQIILNSSMSDERKLMILLFLNVSNPQSIIQNQGEFINERFTRSTDGSNRNDRSQRAI